MKETLIVKGNNNYHIPHMGKKSLERRGELPTSIVISPQLVEESRKWAEEGHLEDDQEEANYGDED